MQARPPVVPPMPLESTQTAGSADAQTRRGPGYALHAGCPYADHGPDPTATRAPGADQGWSAISTMTASANLAHDTTDQVVARTAPEPIMRPHRLRPELLAPVAAGTGPPGPVPCTVGRMCALGGEVRVGDGEHVPLYATGQGLIEDSGHGKTRRQVMSQQAATNPTYPTL